MATQSKIILVTGGTGQQGEQLRLRLTKGQKVRVMSRTPEKASARAKAGAEVSPAMPINLSWMPLRNFGNRL